MTIAQIKQSIQTQLRLSILGRARRKGLEVRKARVVFVTHNW